MKFSIESGFFILGPSLAAEKQGLGLKISIENENFVRGGMVFFMRSSENEFFRSPGPLGTFCTEISSGRPGCHVPGLTPKLSPGHI